MPWQYYEMSYGLNVEMHKQTEICKRLDAIIRQVTPFLSTDHQQSVAVAVERAKQITMQELNVVMQQAAAGGIPGMPGAAGAMPGLPPGIRRRPGEDSEVQAGNAVPHDQVRRVQRVPPSWTRPGGCPRGKDPQAPQSQGQTESQGRAGPRGNSR